jgi:hypothetical protein
MTELIWALIVIAGCIVLTWLAVAAACGLHIVQAC